MNRKLVFVHGRAQQGKDPAALKGEWLEALGEGLRRIGVDRLPIDAADVASPYYGDTLRDLDHGVAPDASAPVVVRGLAAGAPDEAFLAAVIEQAGRAAGLDEDAVAACLEPGAGSRATTRTRGPLNWEWTQALLAALDRYVPFASGASLALFTRDVYRYLHQARLREAIESGVREAFTAEREMVVVAHSLGTIVAYRLLRQAGELAGWKVPLFVTLGSPLGIPEVRRELADAATLRLPRCAGAWINAVGGRDVVAPFPHDPAQFPLDPPAPAIENYRGVRNRTENRHGIAGYLDDPEVARRIHAALG